MELKNVTCITPEEFSRECEKWAGKSVIRGRKLIACGAVVAELRNNHGGRREGSGRKATGRSVILSVRISPEAASIVEAAANKSEFIDRLILGK